jgi:16S rRNA (cytidine1402-2'-O)-methyltransferase
MGTLYLVATPIGNLEDISARALRVLREVDLIAAEDTRQTRKLLQHYDIDTPTTSYHEHSKPGKLRRILEALREGNVAVVSDAGTPALNDPGYQLVVEAIQGGYEVSPIPGPSAPVAALVVSGLPTGAFLYLGYLPRKSGERRRLLEEVARMPYTLIFLETPQRLLSALADIQQELGNRRIAVGRELTKLFEEIFRGDVESAREHFAGQPPRGEFTLVLEGYITEEEPWTEEQMQLELKKRLDAGGKPSKIASQVASESGWTRASVYKLLLALKEKE